MDLVHERGHEGALVGVQGGHDAAGVAATAAAEGPGHQESFWKVAHSP